MRKLEDYNFDKIKNPFSENGEFALLKEEDSEVTVEGKEINYLGIIYEDTGSGEKFTTTQIDEVNLERVKDILSKSPEKP